MGHIEAIPGLEMITSPAQTFVKGSDGPLLTDEVAFHISQALELPHVEIKEGKKDVMHAIISKNGKVGLFLYSPLPGYESTRPERIILGFEGTKTKGGVILFNPSSVVADRKVGQILVRKEIGEYENYFTFDRGGRFTQVNDIKRTPILM
jgi:hypothetical protein